MQSFTTIGVPYVLIVSPFLLKDEPHTCQIQAFGLTNKAAVDPTYESDITLFTTPITNDTDPSTGVTSQYHFPDFLPIIPTQ